MDFRAFSTSNDSPPQWLISVVNLAYDYAYRIWETMQASEHRMNWRQWLAAIVLGTLYIAWREHGGLWGFARRFFAWRIWSHPSSRLDYKIFLLNSLLGVMLTGASGLSSAVMSKWLLDWCVVSPVPTTAPWSMSLYVAYSIGVFIVADFGQFCNHILHHVCPLLWPFHAVHHSAEVMTPLALYRKHPLYDAMKRLIVITCVAVFNVLIAWSLGTRPEFSSMAGQHVIAEVVLLAAANLRHSHIALDWGPWLGRILISPAQHQLHHSRDPADFNCNFGASLAIWDGLAGTLRWPLTTREIQFGLPIAEQSQHTLATAYLRPFVQSWQILRGWIQPITTRATRWIYVCSRVASKTMSGKRSSTFCKFQRLGAK